MDKDRLFLARLEDMLGRAEDRYMTVAGDFMDAHQKKLATDFMRQMKIPEASRTGDDYQGIRYMFAGGYEGAERTVPLFVPDYEQGDVTNEFLTAVRVRISPGVKQLTHRDYLGSLMGLGIDREVTGDILVRDEDSDEGPGADIIVASSIADFILSDYIKAGRTYLSCETIPLVYVYKGTGKVTYRKDTVASLRLDSVVAGGFRLSRGKAAEAVRMGLVAVNGAEALKTDMEVEEGDIISFRGRGRVTLSQVGGSSRKGRVFIEFAIPG